MGADSLTRLPLPPADLASRELPLTRIEGQLYRVHQVANGPQKPSGILYRSRHNPQLTCVAVFSTAQSRLRLKQTTALLDPSLRDWTTKQLRRYRLALLPAMG